MRRGGDCEDFATAKYFLLRMLGVPAENMRIVVAYERRERGYHAVLALKHNSGAVWLLDTDKIRRNSHSGYRYLYAVNENSVWDHAPKPVKNPGESNMKRMFVASAALALVASVGVYADEQGTVTAPSPEGKKNACKPLSRSM